jgi:hypothetical protein
MAFIKFKIHRRSNENGDSIYTKIGRIESDMDWESTIETNLIIHALSHKGGKIELVSDFILDLGQLDNELYLLG